MTTAFDSINLQTLRKDRVKSMLISFLLSAICLFILYFFTLALPDPPLKADTSGVIINIGVVDEGQGDVQPQDVNGGIPTQQSTVATPPSKSDNLMTDENTNAPHVPPQTTSTATTPPVINAPVIKKPDPRFTVKPKGPKTTNSTSQGTGHKPGDQGSPNGDPNGTAYKGNPGDPIGMPSYKLTGRTMTAPFLPQNTCGAYGKIEIKITVDKNGTVLFAIPTGVGTTSNKCLKDLAVASAKTWRFNKTTDPNIPDNQTGTMTFNFVAK